jgi:hypothetical protein
VSAEFLERVLAQTEAAAADSEAIRPAEREALLSVAKKYRGQQLCLDPIGVDLVQAMLTSQFPGNGVNWRSVAADVAFVLMDDPVSLPKVESLWTHLSEMLK